MHHIIKPKKEEETMLPPKKKGRLRSNSSKTRSLPSRSETTNPHSTKEKSKISNSGLEERKASRSLLKKIDEYAKFKECDELKLNSRKKTAKSNSDGAVHKRNRISSDQVSRN